METTKIIGDTGEKIAEDYLKKHGYKIIERRWKYSRIGEIDLIAEEKGTIVFVEVKFRRSNKFGAAIEAISQKKFEKIYASALFYLQNCRKKYKNFRIDLIAIDSNEQSKNGYDIQHIKSLGV